MVLEQVITCSLPLLEQIFLTGIMAHGEVTLVQAFPEGKGPHRSKEKV